MARGNLELTGGKPACLAHGGSLCFFFFFCSRSAFDSPSSYFEVLEKTCVCLMLHDLCYSSSHFLGNVTGWRRRRRRFRSFSFRFNFLGGLCWVCVPCFVLELLLLFVLYAGGGSLSFSLPCSLAPSLYGAARPTHEPCAEIPKDPLTTLSKGLGRSGANLRPPPPAFVA